MDTPDRAADLADPNLVEAINKEWLVLSSCSIVKSQDSSKRKSVKFTNSWSVAGGPLQTSGRAKRRTLPNESSWLLQEQKKHKQHQGGLILYDNISFADSLFGIKGIEASLSEHGSGSNNEQEQSHARVGRFRIFLGFYMLLGITLAIYSRSALSLAAVGMLARNEANKELVEFIEQRQDQLKASEVDLGGSCPISGKPPARTYNNTAFTKSNLPNDLEGNITKDAFNNYIKRRIEKGELVDWTPSEQGLIFAAGCAGNLLIAVPLTRLGEIYGPKWIIFVALLGSTVQAAFMPFVAPCKVVFVIVFQIIFNGITYGADCVAYTLFAHWLTPPELAFFVASLLICYQSGMIISSLITATILTQNISWSWCFYAPAILCGVWTLGWITIGASEPSKSWIISKQELEFLSTRSKISQYRISLSKTDTDHKTSHSVSWRKLFSDPNIWAIIAVKFSLRWYFSVHASLMPTYLSSVAHMSVTTIGSLNMLNSIICMVSGLLTSYFTRSVVQKRPFNISLATFRKCFQSMVNFGLVLTILFFIMYDCDMWIIVGSLIIGGICINFYVAAALQLPLDLSPDHCGLITSISNTLAWGQALGAPISGLILNGGPRDRARWRIVWLVAALLNTASGILFLYLVDSKPRDYNKYTVTRADTHDEESYYSNLLVEEEAKASHTSRKGGTNSAQK